MKWALIVAAAAISLVGFPMMAAAAGGYSEKVKRFAAAIASAEGFGVKYARPTENNNPGDLVENGDLGKDDNGYAKYSTAQAGWDALYEQLQFIVDGKSAFYNLDMTISDMAYTYTSTQQDAWSDNVAAYLGVTRDTGIRGLLT